MQNEKILLTVVLPVSKMAGKLEFFKEWMLLAQLKPISVIIVHDWRDAETEKELAQFLEAFNEENFRLVSGKYGSPGYARNAGLTNSLSEWVSFWDSDDLPNLENVFHAIETSTLDDEVLIGSFETIDSRKSVVKRCIVNDQWQIDVAKSPGMWRMVFRRNLLEEAKFSDLLMGEDQLFLIQNRIFDRRIRIFKDIFYSYQIMQEEQATRSKQSLTDLNRCLELFEEELGRAEGANKFYYQVMYIKQIISAVRYLGFRGKFQALHRLLLFIFKNGPLATSKLMARIVRE
jgi:glycosyltransferase involved in cell wall biosynthesis